MTPEEVPAELLRVVKLRTSSPRVTGFAEPHGFEDEGDDEYDDDGVDNLT